MAKFFLIFFVFFSPFFSCAAEMGVVVDEEWKTVKDFSLEIEQGSPLDFSVFFDEKSIDSVVGVDADGGFSVSGSQVRFLCAPMILTPPYGGFPDHATSDRYTLQLKRAGYNLVRIHHIETTLMTGRVRDFDYDPEQLDRLHYFLASLRKAGIRWLIDAATSDNGAYGNVLPHRWINRHDIKVRVHIDQDVQEHWRRMVTSLYGRINPYTGSSILADSALFGVVLFNEGGLQFLTHVRRQVPDSLRPVLVEWLRKRYANRRDFSEIWKQPVSVLQTGKVEMPGHGERSKRMEDVLSFYDELQKETANWMQAHLTSRGYRGLVTAYNNMPTVHMTASRGRFGWVDMHSYHDESFGFDRGSRQRNDSSLDGGLKYLTQLASSNLAGRAYSISEWGQPFWNAWRRESALAGPAIASLQAWGAICQHASTAVDLSYANNSGWKQRIMPYAVGLDPVGRAVETLSALLYRRGDVAMARHEVQLMLPPPQHAGNANFWGVPDSVERLALVTRVRSVQAGESSTGQKVKATINVSAQGDFERILSRITSGLGAPTAFSGEAESRLAEKLTGSVFRPDQGRFLSDTHEIYFSFPQRRIEVRTQRTVGASFDQVRVPIDLGVLRVLTASQPAMVALSSLDGKPLVESDRALLIVVTDALNTGMRFKSSDRKELVELGRLPVRIAPSKVEVSLTGSRSTRITPLRANGAAAGAGDVYLPSESFYVDPANRDGGPGFYYLLERVR